MSEEETTAWEKWKAAHPSLEWQRCSKDPIYFTKDSMPSTVQSLQNLRAAYKQSAEACVQESQWEDAVAFCVKLLIVEAEIRAMEKK